MRTKVFLTVLLAAITSLSIGCIPSSQHTKAIAGQHPQSFETVITKTVKTDYLLYLPQKYHMSNEDWPLILFLHGAGERGSDLNKVAKHGPPKIAREIEKDANEKGAEELPFIIVSPQCPKGSWWSSTDQIDVLTALLDDIVSQYRIDRQRIYLTGLSMGGFGTWSLAAACPDRFAAIAPICGGGDPKDAPSIAHLPIWVFHGAKDTVVALEKSEEMVAALKAASNDVKFTVYPNAGHDSWTATYNNPELFEWMLKQKRADIE